MTEQIQISRQNIEEDAGRIESVAGYLIKAPLDSQDTRSTIPANERAGRHMIVRRKESSTWGIY